MSQENEIRTSKAASTEKAVKRQLAKGEQQDSSIEEDAHRIAAAVVRHWGTHAPEVLRRATQISEDEEIRARWKSE